MFMRWIKRASVEKSVSTERLLQNICNTFTENEQWNWNVDYIFYKNADG